LNSLLHYLLSELEYGRAHTEDNTIKRDKFTISPALNDLIRVYLEFRQDCSESLNLKIVKKFLEDLFNFMKKIRQRTAGTEYFLAVTQIGNIMLRFQENQKT